MDDIFGIPAPLLFGQLLLGLINGAFYAMLSLGLAVIFGLLNIINFTHGAQFMMGAFAAWMLLSLGNVPAARTGFALMLLPLAVLLLDWLLAALRVAHRLRIGLATLFAVLWAGSVFMEGGGPISGALGTLFPQGLSYWWALLIGPVVVGATGILLERLMISRLYKLDHLYGLLLTFGIGLIIEGVFRNEFGSSGLPYRIPPELSGAWDLGFMFMPVYRGWVVIAALALCLGTWLLIEKTRLGAYLRAATENAALVQAFGVNVPRMVTLTYGFGVALAAIAGVLAAPIYSVNPQMGTNLIIVVFAVVVIGGMGSILGAILTGFALGVVEGLTKVFWPEASATVIFVIMAIVLLTRPAGLFGRA
ncbi:branched-chain amino acid ABC transporter permease [Crenalkalicoccus roseus]|uniref:branched-chain amino acid ABC transporter permease n=1 Tax=Crenalkalicoccus roseus TaxID=1485588 RepID=UPI00108030B7|nr:branched-chain amino acid ABC transporter permease [Crenalkalicoccus roseus]